MFMLLNEVHKTDVKTQASLNEKDWVLTTLGIILAFSILTWIVQAVLACMSSNANSLAAIGFIIYAFGNGMGEFYNHLLAGITLNN